ncbi:putative N-acetyltransferase (TIGR04045 family) [Williamsia limnetica]|uniref:Putative N-acetyltransferase (TIGR04045 family) n=1 Tax=Williamsia limnetica TaxID=882452 RepID=A0A318RJ48_WILLI|nr:MSMEG_0567/sll0787 family protein [Williamsia limnetica]PYE15180.1 putative N-acetyltransferase (TIGR04045 family) [Williamsia limnetica]
MQVSAHDLAILTGPRPARAPSAGFLIQPAENAAHLADYAALRHGAFVVEQGLFSGTDHDDIDDDPRTVVLCAIGDDGAFLGGVRLAPATPEDIGWWTGSRLVVAPTDHARGVGPALVRAACAHAENAGVLRFDAAVQQRYAPMFSRLGWDRVADVDVAGVSHAAMRWPINKIERLVAGTKAMLADVLAPLGAMPMGLGPSGFRGDDGTPVPGTDMIAACDAIIPSMVERDPEWAGWCAVLVNLNDLSAMGATPVGLLDAVGAPTRSQLTRIIRGMAKAAAAWNVPVLGGHTQAGVPSSLSVTALGRTSTPIPAGGGKVGHEVRLTADLGGGWRQGYAGHQWDSTSHRSADQLTAMSSFVQRAAPAAAKDVSMAGLVGTTGMLAEASGTGAVLDVGDIPRPDGVPLGQWITAFPGFAMITTDSPGHTVPDAGPARSAVCGRLTDTPGVGLRWPDGQITQAVRATVTGLGTA